MSEEASSNLQEQQQLRRDKLKAWPIQARRIAMIYHRCLGKRLPSGLW